MFTCSRKATFTEINLTFTIEACRLMTTEVVDVLPSEAIVIEVSMQ